MSVSQKGLGEIGSNFMYLMYFTVSIYSLGQDYEIGRGVISSNYIRMTVIYVTMSVIELKLRFILISKMNSKISSVKLKMY